MITIANQKGGVGKTTTAVNLAAALAQHGSRVLVIDLDPQGNASTALDVEHRVGTTSIYHVLVEDQPLVGIIHAVEDIPLLYCAPATIDLAGAEIELVPMVAREGRLSRALRSYDESQLDYILIDCPPSLGLLTVNALVAAAEVLIPIQCEYYALEGLEQLLRTVNLVKSHLNPDLTVSTILLTMFDGRTRLASQVADEVREHFGEVVLESIIPRSVRVSEAPSYGQSVMTYDPASSGAVAYLEAAREMAHRSAPGQPAGAWSVRPPGLGPPGSGRAGQARLRLRRTGWPVAARRPPAQPPAAATMTVTPATRKTGRGSPPSATVAAPAATTPNGSTARNRTRTVLVTRPSRSRGTSRCR